MTHAQTADVRTGTTIPAMLAALAAVAIAGTAIVLAQLGPLDLRIGAPAAAQDQALIQSGQAWEHQRQQQASGGVVSSSVLQSGRDWESRNAATTPGAAAADFRGELHSEYLIEMFGADDSATAPAAGTDIRGELHSEYLIEMFGADDDSAAVPASGTESHRTPQAR